MGQTRKTSYAQSAQVRAIRKKMVTIMQREASSCDLAELVKRKLINETIGREIDKATQGIYPLQNVMIRKVKMLRAPKTVKFLTFTICIAWLMFLSVLSVSMVHSSI